MLKKAGFVVLGATAGMISLAPLASAGEAPSHGGHDDDHGHSRASSDCASATAVGGRQANTGSQLVGVNNSNIQAPINQLGVLSSYENDCDDDDRHGRHGHRHGGHDHGHRHGGHDHDHDHDRDRDRDRDGGSSSSATAVGGDQINTGDQLIGINNTNIQAPINQLGVLSSYEND